MNLNLQQIKSEFPRDYELCYESIAHKKVHDADFYIANPLGKKGFIWFTSYNENDMCLFLETSDNYNINNITILKTSFDHKLCFGTIFQGVYFEWNKNNCFSINNIYYYKGNKIEEKDYKNKLIFINDILKKDISQLALTSDFTIFGLPFITNCFQNCLNMCEQLPYKVSSISFRYVNSKKCLFVPYFKPGTKQTNIISQEPKIFKAVPDIQNDIYHLLVWKSGKEYEYDTAFVPDYKTSVYLNNLFRNIKENKCLDALEESDDEDEFENNQIDKYVFLNKSYKMICEYNSKFNKWVPTSLANKTSKIVTINELINNRDFSYKNTNTNINTNKIVNNRLPKDYKNSKNIL
jgi:hypothetical protein